MTGTNRTEQNQSKLRLGDTMTQYRDEGIFGPKEEPTGADWATSELLSFLRLYREIIHNISDWVIVAHQVEWPARPPLSSSVPEQDSKPQTAPGASPTLLFIHFALNNINPSPLKNSCPGQTEVIKGLQIGTCAPGLLETGNTGSHHTRRQVKSWMAAVRRSLRASSCFDVVWRSRDRLIQLRQPERPRYTQRDVPTAAAEHWQRNFNATLGRYITEDVPARISGTFSANSPVTTQPGHNKHTWSCGPVRVDGLQFADVEHGPERGPVSLHAAHYLPEGTKPRCHGEHFLLPLLRQSQVHVLRLLHTGRGEQPLAGSGRWARACAEEEGSKKEMKSEKGCCCSACCAVQVGGNMCGPSCLDIFSSSRQWSVAILTLDWSRDAMFPDVFTDWEGSDYEGIIHCEETSSGMKSRLDRTRQGDVRQEEEEEMKGCLVPDWWASLSFVFDTPAPSGAAVPFISHVTGRQGESRCERRSLLLLMNLLQVQSLRDGDATACHFPKLLDPQNIGNDSMFPREAGSKDTSVRGPGWSHFTGRCHMHEPDENEAQLETGSHTVASDFSSSSSSTSLFPSLSGERSMLTMEHEVDVALFLLKTKNRKYRFNAHEENSRLRLIPPVGKARATENRNFLARWCYCCRE
ncbi:unnamed protein product [Pleuronectes platessa]|uniref:Uncharacterized protein n=1 Tax=Pleuronectes platessa TaxID=8262 RepID=A0A9N7YN51_PLEPL|nr:unnamed protein product [Pleuronectes platessa]